MRSVRKWSYRNVSSLSFYFCITLGCVVISIFGRINSCLLQGAFSFFFLFLLSFSLLLRWITWWISLPIPSAINLLIIKIQRSDNELFPFGNSGYSLERKKIVHFLYYKDSHKETKEIKTVHRLDGDLFLLMYKCGILSLWGYKAWKSWAVTKAWTRTFSVTGRM